MIKKFAGRRNQKTYTETLADSVMPQHSVEAIMKTYENIDDHGVMAAAKHVFSTNGQSNVARNLRIAFRQILKVRGLKIKE